MSLLKISLFINQTNRNKSSAYNNSILRNGFSLFTDRLRGKPQDQPYNYYKRPLHGCRGRLATLSATARRSHNLSRAQLFSTDTYRRVSSQITNNL
jgi:hypothetical protein